MSSQPPTHPNAHATPPRSQPVEDDEAAAKEEDEHGYGSGAAGRCQEVCYGRHNTWQVLNQPRGDKVSKYRKCQDLRKQSQG